MKEFKVNEYITLKFEDGRTNIYIKGNDYPSMQYWPKKLDWSHRSNMQVWAINNYDTHLLHPNLAFSLLKELIEAGDPLANKVFKEEVMKRFLEGPQNIRRFLCKELGYLDVLTKEERRVLFESDIEVIEELEIILHECFERNEIEQFRIVVPHLDLSFATLMWKDGNVVGLNAGCRYLKETPELIRKLKNLEILILKRMPEDKLPEWLLELKSLKKLVFIYGKLISLPEWIGEFEHLEHLEVHHNEIEYLPESIGNLTSLRYLNLSDNNLKGIIPDSIGNLSSLGYLDLNNNNLLSLPESIGDCKALKEVYIWENKLESLPESIGNLELLEELELVGNWLTYIPDSICKLKSLKKLSLSHNPIESIPDEIVNLPSLEWLSLINTRIDEYWHLIFPLEEKGVRLLF